AAAREPGPGVELGEHDGAEKGIRAGAPSGGRVAAQRVVLAEDERARRERVWAAGRAVLAQATGARVGHLGRVEPHFIGDDPFARRLVDGLRRLRVALRGAV